MLSSMPCSAPMERSPTLSMSEDRYQRNFKKDMLEAVDMLLDFQEKLAKLHPQCTHMIENMLQRPKY